MKPRHTTSTERMRQLRLRRQAAGEVERSVSAHPDDWPQIRALERACRSARVDASVSPPIRIGDYPELQLIAWQRDPDTRLNPAEALALYEAHWRYLDPDKLGAEEQALINQLIRQHGAGVLNV
ncbi:MAG: hypothetical protein WD572_08500 [Gammaproteobacteria bacterium]